MRKDYLQMAFAVLVVLLLSSMSGLPAVIEPETANVSDAVEEVIIEVQEVTEKVTETEFIEVEGEDKNNTVYLESFNEDELESEYGDVQSGIDLLDNPL